MCSSEFSMAITHVADGSERIGTSRSAQRKHSSLETIHSSVSSNTTSESNSPFQTLFLNSFCRQIYLPLLLILVIPPFVTGLQMGSTKLNNDVCATKQYFVVINIGSVSL
jgi:hypothetical protein